MIDPGPRQEAERIHASVIWIVGLSGALITVLLVAIAWWLVVPQPPGVRSPAQPSPLERNLFDRAAGGAAARAVGARRLERYEWVDRRAGVVRIPIDRAIDAVVADPSLIEARSPAIAGEAGEGRGGEPMRWLGWLPAVMPAVMMIGHAAAAAAGPGEPAPPGSPAWAEGADVTEHLGERLPLELELVDAAGRRTALRSLFDGTHPVLLVLAYYECPQLCSLVLDGAVAAMHAIERNGWQPGREYRVATISFDPAERIDQAARKQASVLARLGQGDPAVWPFFVGNADAVRALTERLGFTFLRDPKTGTLAHAAVVFVLTPDGVISRYLYGVDFPPRDLRLALLGASGGKTGSFGDKVVMRCFQYDPATRRYGLFIARFMKLGGVLIFLVVLATLSGFVRHDRRRQRAERAP